MDQIHWPTTTWLDHVTSVESTANSVPYESWPYWHLPYQTTVVYHDVLPRPIRLTVEEVTLLRTRAAADPPLKALLQKFTAQIEIIVEW